MLAEGVMSQVVLARRLWAKGCSDRQLAQIANAGSLAQRRNAVSTDI
jgi:hypothetical protein